MCSESLLVALHNSAHEFIVHSSAVHVPLSLRSELPGHVERVQPASNSLLDARFGQVGPEDPDRCQGRGSSVAVCGELATAIARVGPLVVVHDVIPFHPVRLGISVGQQVSFRWVVL